MNVFYLSTDPRQAAQWHCDKHVVKMIVEYAQLLSTCHRVCDGTPTVLNFSDERLFKGEVRARHHRRTFWAMPGEIVEVIDAPPPKLADVTVWPPEKRKMIVFDNVLYAASHLSHPCALWIRSSAENYLWLYSLFAHLCDEYTQRYGRVHVTDTRLRELLSNPPKNIPASSDLPVPQAMPDEFKHPDAVTAYQNLYVGSKSRFAKWTNRRPPTWFIKRIKNYDSANFERTGRVAPPATESGGEMYEAVAG